MQGISIIGVGRLGGALAIALSRSGHKIDHLVYRNPGIAKQIAHLISPLPELIPADKLENLVSDVVLIASGDPEIAGVSAELAKALRHNPFVLHTSGSLSSEILTDLQNRGCKTGSMHPLVSISDPIRGASAFSGKYFCLEGDSDAVSTARSLVESLGGHPFSIATQHKALYHASAVTASGHLVALVDTAIEMLSRCGLKETEAKKVLLPLIESTVANLKVQNSSDALTGTFARGDFEAFERHLAAMDALVSEDIRKIYLDLAARSLDLAERIRPGTDGFDRMRERISIAKRNRE